MNLPKAIEILDLLFAHIYEGSDLDRDKAIKLGSEALKATLAVKQAYPHLPWQPLPGED